MLPIATDGRVHAPDAAPACRSVPARRLANLVFKPSKFATRAAEPEAAEASPAPAQKARKQAKVFTVKVEDIKAGDLFDAKVVGGRCIAVTTSPA